MGSAISQIGGAVSGAADRVTKNPGAALGAYLGYGSGVAGLPGAVGGVAGDAALSPGDAPPPPGVDPNLANLRQKQVDYAKDFRSNLPNMKREMGDQFEGSANRQLGAGIRKTNTSNAARGLLYSGINEGDKMGLRANTQSAVAQGKAGINADLENSANTLDAQAVETGVGIQQTQQAIQNQVYSQAMARMNGQNSMIGGALGTGLLLAML